MTTQFFFYCWIFLEEKTALLSKISDINSDILTYVVSIIVEEYTLFGNTVFNQFDINRTVSDTMRFAVSSKELDGTRGRKWTTGKMSHMLFSPLDFILFTYSTWYSLVFNFSQVAKHEWVPGDSYFVFLMLAIKFDRKKNETTQVKWTC